MHRTSLLATKCGRFGFGRVTKRNTSNPYTYGSLRMTLMVKRTSEYYNCRPRKIDLISFKAEWLQKGDSALQDRKAIGTQTAYAQAMGPVSEVRNRSCPM